MPLHSTEITQAIRTGFCKRVDLPGFVNPGYFVDPDGFIYSMNNPANPKLIDAKMGGGLMYVSLYSKEGHIQKLMVGEIVAHTYLQSDGKDPLDTTVLYRDGDPHNNASDNLEWGTPQQQQKQIQSAASNPSPTTSVASNSKSNLQKLSGDLSDDVPVKIAAEEDPLMIQMRVMQEKLEDLQARQRTLYAALKPFSDFALSAGHEVSNGSTVVVESNADTNNHSTITVQDFRNAKDALN